MIWLFQRVLSWRLRQAKYAQIEGWLPRWNKACKKCWSILDKNPPTMKRFALWERNHSRLLRLIDAKIPGKGGRITLSK